MADNGLGFSLKIPDKFLKDAALADAAITKLATTSEASSKKIVDAFKQMSTMGVQPFLDKLNEANKMLPNFKIPKIKMPKEEVDKFTDSITKTALALNKVSNPQTSVSAWTGLANNITQLERKSESLVKSTKEYELTMSRIGAGKGGVVSVSDKSSYENNLKELESTRATIASYKEKQATIIAYQAEQKKVADNALALRNLESQRMSLPEQRKVDEMKKLNDAYRQEEITSKKTADAKVAASDKEIKAIQAKIDAEKRLKDTQERTNRKQGETRNYREGLNELNAYNRAMAASEATITQRTNKITRLTQVEQQLSASSRNYSSEVAKIREATDRLNKTNTEAASKMEAFKKSQSSAGDVAGQLTRKLALVFSVSQIQGYVKNMMKVRGEFELQNRSLQAILQNKEAADKIFNQVVELAVRSPFQIQELIKYTKQLAAYRIETDKLYDTTKMLADVSAGVGVDMSRIILAYGQVKAANFLRGTELRQFSEAGINILGDLAAQFSKVEGKMVSVGDVFERVSKRMVSFEDVEQVFKRMTSEGGVFYNMQAIQAETLVGQMSNLTDSVDIMFNEIGKANDGVLKAAVASIKFMVDNYKIFEIALQTVAAGFAIYVVQATLASVSNRAFAASSVQATIANGGLQAALAKTMIGLKSISTFAKANPLILFASLVTAAGLSIYNHSKNIDEARAKYDVLTDSISRQKKEITDIISKVKERDEQIKSSGDSMTSLEKGTEAYTSAETANNEASEKRNELLDELRVKHPDIYGGIINQKTGTEELTKAQEEYNNQLEITNYLNFLAKQTGGWFSDDLVSNISDLTNSQAEYTKQVGNVDFAWLRLNGRLKEYFATNKWASSELKKEMDDISNSSLSNSEKIIKMDLLAQKSRGVNIGGLRDILSEANDAAYDFSSANRDLIKDQETLGIQIQVLGEDFKRAYNTSTEEGKKKAAETLRIFIDSLGIQEKSVIDFVTKRFEVSIGVKVDVKEAGGEFRGMQKRIKEYVESNKLSVPVIAIDESQTAYFSARKADLKDLQDEEKKLKIAIEQRQDVESNKNALSKVQNGIKDTTKLLKAYGEYEDPANKTSGEDPMKARISIIKEAGKAYEDYLKYYDKETAKLKTQESYKDAFKEAEIKDMAFSMNFDVSGVIAGLETMLKSSVGKTRKLIEKEIADLKTKVDIEVEVKNLEAIQRQVDDVFSGYEFSLELEKTGMGSDLMKQIFNVDTLNLDDVRKKIEELYPDVSKLGTEELKKREEALRRLAGLEENQIKEQAKKYAQYLIKSKDERVAIKEEELRKIAEMEKMKEFNPTQKEQIKAKLQKESTQKIAKVDYEDLKATDLYKKSFEDLGRLGTTTLNLMLIELQRFAKESGQELPIEAFKELTNKIKGLRDEVESRSPFSFLTDSIKEYRQAIKDAEAAQEEFKAASYSLVLAEDNKKVAEQNVEKAQEVVDTAPEDKKAAAIERLRAAQQGLTMATVAAENAVKRKTTADEKQNNALDKQTSAWDKIKKYISDNKNKFDKLGNAIASSIDLAKDLAEGLGMSFSPETNAVIDSMGKSIQLVSSAMAVMEAVTIAADAAGKSLMATLWPLLAIALALAAVFAIINIGDAKKEKQIKKEQDRVEKLERAYNKLEKAIENAYSFNQLTASTEQASKNITAQIASYRNMISAEQDKKKTDHDQIKEWQNTIEDLQEKQKQLIPQMLEALGGFGTQENFKSAADDFASAWLDAFNETGDGLSGLTETFDEFVNNMLKKQIMLKLSQKYIKPILDTFDKMLGEGSAGGESVVKDELDALKELANGKLAGFNEEAMKILDSLGLKPTGEGGELGGLQKGIQGINETQANALESLFSSIRMFSASTDATLTNIYNSLTSGNIETNPILGELRAQSIMISSINKLMNSVVGNGHPKGQSGIRVFID